MLQIQLSVDGHRWKCLFASIHFDFFSFFFYLLYIVNQSSFLNADPSWTIFKQPYRYASLFVCIKQVDKRIISDLKLYPEKCHKQTIHLCLTFANEGKRFRKLTKLKHSILRQCCVDMWPLPKKELKVFLLNYYRFDFIPEILYRCIGQLQCYGRNSLKSVQFRKIQ